MRDKEKDSLGIIWWLLLGLCFLIVPLFLLIWSTDRTRGRVARATVELMMYHMAITNFSGAVGHWPVSLRELESNSAKINFIVAANFNDPWSRPYIFVPYHSATGFGRIVTLGRDGKPGGTGLDADIERRFP